MKTTKNDSMDGNRAVADSVQEAIDELEATSVVFKDAWVSTPQDLTKAAEASSKAMRCFDQLIDKYLHARNTQMANKHYAGSQLQNGFNKPCGIVVSNVTSKQQEELLNSGPGNGFLPSAGVPIDFEALLVKMQFRQEQAGNFRIEDDKHIFLVNVDKKDRTPDCMLEFEVMEFCALCKETVKYLY